MGLLWCQIFAVLVSDSVLLCQRTTQILVSYPLSFVYFLLVTWLSWHTNSLTWVFFLCIVVKMSEMSSQKQKHEKCLFLSLSICFSAFRSHHVTHMCISITCVLFVFVDFHPIHSLMSYTVDWIPFTPFVTQSIFKEVHTWSSWKRKGRDGWK